MQSSAHASSNRVETVYLDAGEYVVEGSIRRADLTGAVHAIPKREAEYEDYGSPGLNAAAVNIGMSQGRMKFEHATRNRVQEWCREDLPNGERCNKPAEFILWGKLFPKEGLGPRCYDHAAKHAGHRALSPSTVEQYAIYVLPRPS